MDFFSRITVTEICTVFTTYHNKGSASVMVNRPTCGLCFCTEGKIVFRQHGEEYVADPNHVIFLPKKANYEFICYAKGTFPMINFHCDTEFTHDRIESVPIENVGLYTRLLKNIGDTLTGSKSTDRFRALSVFYQLLGHISDDSSLPGKAAVLRPALEFLDRNYANSTLTILELAERAHISEVYFRRLFHNHFGISPKQYIKNLRMNRAKELLKNSFVSISSIAEQSGYGNIYHFCRDFKASVGCTPSDFRRTVKNSFM